MIKEYILIKFQYEHYIGARGMLLFLSVCLVIGYI